MAKHVYITHFVGSRISWCRKQAQAKKGPCGLTKSVEMEQSSNPKDPSKRLESGQPTFVHP